jgi:hypothetical protein
MTREAEAHYREETEELRRAHARAPRARALAEELIALEERIYEEPPTADRGRRAARVACDATGIIGLADRGHEIGPDTEREVRLRYGLRLLKER